MSRMAAVFATALLFLHVTLVEALNGGKLREYQNLADLGLEPHVTATGESSPTKLRLARQAAPETTIAAEYMEIPLNHFDSSNASAQTYLNRYWVSTSSYKAGGPVFIYDVGEVDGTDYWEFRLTNDTSFFKQMVDQYNGIGIVWEHRFYGNSTPVNITAETPASAFQYLTSEQAIADVNYFATHFSRQDVNATDLTPTGTPWVFIGGSYPGIRAALMRKFYPKTIVASLASSAPVQVNIQSITPTDWKLTPSRHQST